MSDGKTVTAAIENTASERWVARVVMFVGLSACAVAAAVSVYAYVSTGGHEALPTSQMAKAQYETFAAGDIVEEEPQGKPLRFVNPFDPSEVFHFPPGTTRAEARDKVAAILLERAREREFAHVDSVPRKTH